MASKLGEDTKVPRRIPLRPLPFGSEEITSPTYVAPHPRTSDKATTETATVVAGKATEQVAEPTPTSPIEVPSYKGPSAAWEKDEAIPIQETPAPPSEEEKDVLET